MFKKRDLIVFFAGVEAMHTLSHLVLSFSNNLPITYFFVTVTPELNFLGLAINAVVTAALLWWAYKS